RRSSDLFLQFNDHRGTAQELDLFPYIVRIDGEDRLWDGNSLFGHDLQGAHLVAGHQDPTGFGRTEHSSEFKLFYDGGTMSGHRGTDPGDNGIKFIRDVVGPQIDLWAGLSQFHGTFGVVNELHVMTGLFGLNGQSPCGVYIQAYR